MPKYLNKDNISQKVEEVEEIPKLGLGPAFYRQEFVYDITMQVIYMYVSKALQLLN